MKYIKCEVEHYNLGEVVDCFPVGFLVRDGVDVAISNFTPLNTLAQ